MLASPKNLSQMAAFPKALLPIAASAGGLAIFLIIASTILLSHPIGSRVQGYFYSVDSSAKLDIEIPLANQTTAEIELFNKEPANKSSSDVPLTADDPPRVSGYKAAESKPNQVPYVSSGLPSNDEAEDDSLVRNDSMDAKVDNAVSSASGNKTEDLKSLATIALPSFPSKAHKTFSNDSGELCILRRSEYLDSYLYRHYCSLLLSLASYMDIGFCSMFR